MLSKTSREKLKCATSNHSGNTTYLIFCGLCFWEEKKQFPSKWGSATVGEALITPQGAWGKSGTALQHPVLLQTGWGPVL